MFDDIWLPSNANNCAALLYLVPSPDVAPKVWLKANTPDSCSIMIDHITPPKGFCI